MTRYKSQVDDLEQREDELLKEKRAQSREVSQEAVAFAAMFFLSCCMNLI